MNKANYLLDKKYVTDLLTKKILPMYPDFVAIKNIKIHAYKNHIWDSDSHDGTYHVVIEYKTTFKTKNGKFKRLPIICSAHSDEPRKNVYTSLKYLWENGFDRGYLTIPHALFYSDYFQGTFYRGVEGHNLYHYIRDQKFADIELILSKTAEWFAKLHDLPYENAKNFNPLNSRIETVIPGVDHILNRIKHNYPEYSDTYQKIYSRFVAREKDFFASTDKRWLVHGDAHPENIIRIGTKKIAVIDFTDLCLADFARDLGAFTQQLEYMSMRKINNPEYIKKIKNIFLDEYFKFSKKRERDENVNSRIELYYNWTAMRTASFFLLKDEAKPKRAAPLIKAISKKIS